MLGLLDKTTTSLIGVDFGACSFRAVQLAGKNGAWRIHHWVNIETEPTAADLPPADYEAQMPTVFGPGSFTGEQAAVLLSPPNVEYRLLDLPASVVNKPPAELRNALQFELDRQMPWPTAESEVAAWTVEAGATGTTSTMVVSSRTAHVEKQVDILGRQQLECLRADVVPNAMTRICAPAPGTADAESLIWGVLDIGFQSARLYLIQADRPVYARVLRAGGRDITETLAGALHIDFRIAEQYKRIYGIRRSDRGFRSVAGGLTRIDEEQLPAVLYAILRPTIEEIAKDIERSCQFVLGRLPGASAGPIYLIGGGARLGGLTDALGDMLGVPVMLPDPKHALQAGPAKAPLDEHPACTAANFPVLAACIGLAMIQETRP